MFLSLPSVEKGQSLTGFSRSNFFGHKSFQWWNKFLPNANKQPQTQHPHLQPHGGISPCSGAFGWCVLAQQHPGEGTFISHSPGCFRAITAIYRLTELSMTWVWTSWVFPLELGAWGTAVICPAQQASLDEQEKGTKKAVSLSFSVLGTGPSSVSSAIKIVPWVLIWRWSRNAADASCSSENPQCCQLPPCCGAAGLSRWEQLTSGSCRQEDCLGCF